MEKSRSKGAKENRTRSKSKPKNKRQKSKEKTTDKKRESRINYEYEELEVIEESVEVTEKSLEDFPYKIFSGLNAAAVKELMKVPGLKEVQRQVDVNGVTGIVAEPENYEAFLTAIRILDCDPLILLTPSIYLDAPLRQYQLDVHQFYSRKLSAFCKKNLAAVVPNVFRLTGRNPVNQLVNYRSAAVANFMIRRFQGNDNPPIFNNIPEGTLLGEMMIIYGGGMHQYALGPQRYYR